MPHYSLLKTLTSDFRLEVRGGCGSAPYLPPPQAPAAGTFPPRFAPGDKDFQPPTHDSLLTTQDFWLPTSDSKLTTQESGPPNDAVELVFEPDPGMGLHDRPGGHLPRSAAHRFGEADLVDLGHVGG